ncbi:MAG: S-adenosylmethionine synthetase N-terminal domain-containing protein, partial [Phycisphaerales bacterium]
MNTAIDPRPTDILRPAEFVLPGHPDKLADAIADRIVCAAYRRERRALVGVEVAVHRDVVFIDGRVACRDAESIDFACIAKDVYRSVGYCGRFPPAPHRLRVRTDLALGPLLPGEAEFREVSDDQSIVTGYACSTPGTDMLPVEQAMVGVGFHWVVVLMVVQCEYSTSMSWRVLPEVVRATPSVQAPSVACARA